MSLVDYYMGFYRENGKEHGNHYSNLGLRFILWIYWDSGNKVETTVQSEVNIIYIHIYTYTWIVLGMCWDNGRESGNFTGPD